MKISVTLIEASGSYLDSLQCCIEEGVVLQKLMRAADLLQNVQHVPHVLHRSKYNNIVYFVHK